MGQICHHFGWTLDYLLWEIDWRIVQRMLIDIPVYDDKKNIKEEIELTEQNSDDLKKQLEAFL